MRAVGVSRCLTNQECWMVLADALCTQIAFASESWLRRVLEGFASPTSIFSPKATPAHDIYVLSLFVFAITLGIFLLVAGLLSYALVRFRHRAGEPQSDPVQVYGSQQIEVLWTVIPILIVVVLFLATARQIAVTERAK